MPAAKKTPKVVDELIEKGKPPVDPVKPDGKPDKTITVRAVLPENQIGFIGTNGAKLHLRRHDGDVFQILESQFSEKWMERVEEGVK